MRIFAIASLLAVATAACGDSSGEGGAGGQAGTSVASTGATTKASSAANTTSATTGQSSVSIAATGSTTGGSSSSGNNAEAWVRNVNDIATCAPNAAQGISPVLPDEAGHYAATRLTPPSYPFTVTRIAYDLVVPNGAAQCANQGLAHEVDVFVGSTDAPDASPGEVSTYAVPAAAEGARTIDIELNQPIVLADGESLFVSVQLVGDASTSLCIGSCGEVAPVSDVDYWSNAVASPFSWADMIDDFGFTYNFTTRMFGSAQ